VRLIDIVKRMILPLWKPLLGLVVLAVGGGDWTWGAVPRVANTTLRLPAEPPVYGFGVTPAFPEVTFDAPLVLTAPPGATNQLFVAERAGRIQVMTNLTAPTKTLFLDISARVNASGEGGLLGLAFHPQYEANGRFFVFYTLTTSTVGGGSGFHNRVSRFEVSPDDPWVALPDSEVVLIDQFDRADNHNAGDIHFGPDGYLYVATGDEGGGGDVYMNSRRIDRNFFGAILRLDVDERPGNLEPNPHPAVGTGYRVPVDNPFIGATQFNGAAVDPGQVRTEFWAVGLRNPWRMSFDPVTGWLYCGDVGQSRWEEINVIVRGGDYGWNYREGFEAYAGVPPPGVTFVDPIWAHSHTGTATNRGNSVTGGVVYRGTRLSQLHGDYVYADFGSGNVWALTFDGREVTRYRHLTVVPRIAEFGVDPATGDVLLASLSGPIYRLDYHDEPTGDPLPQTLAETGAFSDLQQLTPHPGIVPYQVNVPFWSDHALKRRWFSVAGMDERFEFRPAAPWSAPAGTVWIKQFDLELVQGDPESRRRLETRFLVRNTAGSYGVTYRWNDEQTGAVLVPEEGMEEEFVITDETGMRTQVWRYPARSECATCHTPMAGHALSFNTAQLNCEVSVGEDRTNQILALGDYGYFANPPSEVAGLPAHAPLDDLAANLQDRVRSYLAVNCVQCHQPGGQARGSWDARYETPLAEAGIINGPIEDLRGDAANRVIVPGDPDRSMILERVSGLSAGQMPPLATSVVNTEAVEWLRTWVLAEPRSEFSGVTRTAEGGIELRMDLSPEHRHRMESTRDLSAGWLEEVVLEAAPDGGAVFVSPLCDDPERYYRIVWP
jgi:glucose/arabinose dehydrogenase